MQVIRAIETRYAGCRFRSRVEARWAVFFDAIEEPWEYEKEGYSLPSGNYLPDFWLPRPGLWVEIKGADATGDEQRLCEELGDTTDRPVLLLTGVPGSHRIQLYCSYIWGSGGGTGWEMSDHVYLAISKSTHGACMCLAADRDLEDFSVCTPTSFESTLAGACSCDVLSGHFISSALIRARSARFEHGEKP